MTVFKLLEHLCPVYLPLHLSPFKLSLTKFNGENTLVCIYYVYRLTCDHPDAPIMEFAPVDVSRVRIGTIGPVADMFGLRFNNVFSIERSEMEGS